MFDLSCQLIWQSISGWFLNDGHGPKILIIVAVAILIYVIIKRFGEAVVRLMVKKTYTDQDARGIEKRAQTISMIISVTGKIVITIIALFLILPELGIDVTALVAGAGIIGLAVGIGAQKLIKDIIEGFFILVEDQYRVGDWIRVTGAGYDIKGKVESVSLKRTVIRSLDGVLHSISHGDTARIANLTKGISRVNVDVYISYKADLLKAEKLINSIGKDLANDARFGPYIVKPPEFWGVESLENGKVTVAVLGETQPGRQWEVATELRTRIKLVFTKEGIEMK